MLLGITFTDRLKLSSFSLKCLNIFDQTFQQGPFRRTREDHNLLRALHADDPSILHLKMPDYCWTGERQKR